MKSIILFTLILISCLAHGQIKFEGVNNTQYYQFIRNGVGSAVYINQTSTEITKPILRLSSGTPNANVGVKFTVENDGSVGIGTTSPGEKLHVEGNIRVGENFKYLIKRYNVTSEMFITGHGQGAGWMINAEYSGSGNPQNSASFSVNSGTYNTGAGYLDFDGNARMWSLFASEGTSNIGSPVSFKSLADFRLNQYIRLSSSGSSNDLYITSNGTIGIGTTETFGYTLAVNGTIGCKEVRVENTSSWPDFVFSSGYNLRPLEDVENHIMEKGHLKDIPSAEEVKINGIFLGEMDAKLLRKIEELTLYMIEINKQNQIQQKLIEQLQKEMSTLKN